LVVTLGQQLVTSELVEDVRMLRNRRITPNKAMNCFCAASPMTCSPSGTTSVSSATAFSYWA
jgi:hypothetical protein